MTSHQCGFRVYYGDTDAGGVMYHAAYIDFFARARNEWIRDRGFSLSNQRKWGICFIVHALSSVFHKPAKLDDWVEIQTDLNAFSRVKMTFKQRMYRQGELICEAQVDVVSVDLHSLQVKRLPKECLPSN
jgi:acyl-CoA thioester hydrolase